MVPVWDYVRLRRRADSKGKPLTNEYWESTEHIQPSGIPQIKPHLNLNQGNECKEHEILGAVAPSPCSLKLMMTRIVRGKWEERKKGIN